MKSIQIDKNYKDIKEIRRLYNSSFPNDERIPFKRLINNLDTDRVMYAYYDDQLIGMSFLFLYNDLAYLSYICVEEDLRDKGYGSKILNKVKDDFKDYRIVLDIEEVVKNSENYEERKRRKDFYLKNGFESANIFYHIYHVDYEILHYGKDVNRDDWHSIIKKHWGKFADTITYR